MTQTLTAPTAQDVWRNAPDGERFWYLPGWSPAALPRVLAFTGGKWAVLAPSGSRWVIRLQHKDRVRVLAFYREAVQA